MLSLPFFFFFFFVTNPDECARLLKKIHPLCRSFGHAGIDKRVFHHFHSRLLNGESATVGHHTSHGFKKKGGGNIIKSCLLVSHTMLAIEDWESAEHGKLLRQWLPTIGPKSKALSLYTGLIRAESSVLVQLRTGKIGLKANLASIEAVESRPLRLRPGA